MAKLQINGCADHVTRTVDIAKSNQHHFKSRVATVLTSFAMLSSVVSMTSHADTKLGYRMSSPPAHTPNYSQQQYSNNSFGSTFSNSTYKDVTVPPHMTRPPVYQQNYPQYPYPNYPHQNQPHPNQPYPNQPYPPYPQGNGVTIIYNQSLPSQTTYSNQSYGYVNGENGSIQSSTYMLISDWRRYGLPDPSVGMHWVYQNGRYIQIPNDR